MNQKPLSNSEIYKNNFLRQFKKNTHKRLFITTGLISLINILSIIKNQNNKVWQNFLIIYSSTPDNNFYEFSLKLIQSEIFDHFDSANNIEEEKNISIIDNISFIENFDEIYLTPQYNFTDIYKHRHINLVEEGISSYFHFENIIYDNVKNVFLSQYLGKVQHQEDAYLDKIKNLNKENVKKIIYEIRKRNNLDFSYLKRNNQIVMLSQYIYQYIMTNEEIFLFYKRHIDTLLQMGYNVLFKSHPRFPSEIAQKLSAFYKNEKLFLAFPDEIRYPVELIMPDLDCCAIVCSMSGGALNCSHLFDIPCFGFGAKLMNHSSEYINMYRQFFLKYLPHISEIHPNYKWIKLSTAIKLHEIPKFTQIRLETTNICGYNCFMCPRKKMTRKIGTMSMEDLDYVIDCFDYIKYELDFHMHGYGEALICDDLPQRLSLLTARKPNFTPLIYTTLGYKKDKEWIESLFKNGLGKLIVSLYGYDKNTYHAVHGIDKFDLVKSNLEFIARLKNTYGFKLSICLDQFGENYPLPEGYTYEMLQQLKSDFILYLNKLGINDITEQILHNFGDGFTNLSTLKKTVPCSVCWGNRRQHISISWDLNISPCAYDYNCSVIWGNLRKNSLEEIYKSQERISFIKSHFGFGEQPMICASGSCYPNEGNHDNEYNIVKKFMGTKNDSP